jgi:predicted amidohydrolase
MCAQRGAKLICLPENFAFVGTHFEESIRMAEPLYGPIIKKYKQIALENQIWLSLGGF